LLARLEHGLAVRARQPRMPVSEPSTAAPRVFPEAGDDRLQNAIESLQRLAARND
jgi:hypothetical protein